MNSIQKVIFAGCILLLAAFLFPPFQNIHPNGGAHNAGYSFILSPPKGPWGNSKVDVVLLMAEWLGIMLLAGGMACISLMGEYDRN